MPEASLLAPGQDLLLGALTGLIFGFLLQRGGVTRADTILGQFLLRDFTVLKVMLTAIVVGGTGVYAMLGLGLIEHLHVKSATVWGNLLGGAIFGVGMAVLGYCPGTGVAAIGDGSRDAIPGVIGGVAGAAVYAEVQPWVAANLLTRLDLGKVTLPGTAHVSPWVCLLVLGAAAAAVFVFVERWERARGTA